MKIRIILLILALMVCFAGVAAADKTDDMISRYYQNVLDREPEEAGARDWKAEIERLTSLGIDIKEGFIAMAKFFFISLEYEGKSKRDTEYIVDLYKTFLDRIPSAGETAAWEAVLSAGTSWKVVYNSFAYSREFQQYMESKFGDKLADPACNLVNDFYRGLLNRLPEDKGFDGWLEEMRASQLEGSDAVRDLCYRIALGFLNSEEYKKFKRSDRQFLEDLYDGILRRGASKAEFDSWLSLMENGMTRQAVLQGFTDSPEFKLKALLVSRGLNVRLTLEDAWNLIQYSTSGDADKDYLPDDVEMLLGTDPFNRDSDKDGIFDYTEIFGIQTPPSDKDFDSKAWIPDADKDGDIAALDSDDNDDGEHDGENVDIDGDGIPNYLEYYGYTYDWFTDTYSLWDGVSYDEPYFKTDPRQVSTDQDPYSDGVEASGNLIDVLIHHPGDLPMVPAYPNIVVRLEGYDVTLNSEISYSHGASLSEESNWSRQTTVERAFEVGINWEVGAEAKVGVAEWLTLSGKFGMNYNWTQTNSTTRSTGGSITKASNWQKATSSNPSTAARIKLKLKVYNFGTAAASNITPTLTMKIGGMSVLTFKPANPIGILEPKGEYPVQDGTYWVVDKSDSGQEIYLTLDELRALECGAPLNIEVTQLDGEVMLLDKDGQWQNAGKWGEYMARCEAVSANIKIDIGNGNMVHQLVYSDDSPTAPVVTLGDALRWIASYEERPDGAYISYIDRFGMRKKSPLADWNFIFDMRTLFNNGIEFGQNEAAADVNLTDLILGPDTAIIARAPRESLDLPLPEIYYAYYDTKANMIKVSAGDYNGIASVYFIDKFNNKHEMEEVLPGSGMFVLDTSEIDNGTYQPVFNEASGIEGELFEKVEVVNKDGDVIEQPLVATHTPERVAGPIKINGVSISAKSNTFTADIDFDPYFPPVVEIYFSSGVKIKMAKHSFYWDPDYASLWVYNYDPATYVPSDFIDAWVVATVDTDCSLEPSPTTNGDSNCFAGYVVPASAISDDACGSGQGGLSGYFTPVPFSEIARYDVVDLDQKTGDECVFNPVRVQEDVFWSGFNYDKKYDLALKPDLYDAYFDTYYGAAQVTTMPFEDINAGNIPGLASKDGTGGSNFFNWSLPWAGSSESYPGEIWVIKTSGGKYVKLKIEWVKGQGYAGVHSVSHSTISWAIYEP